MTQTEVAYGGYGSSLRDLPRLRSSRRRRVSSWDRSGGNADYHVVEPGTTALLADIAGPASINHIWCTVAVSPEVRYQDVSDWAEVSDHLRRLLLRITWDEQEHPSVLAPLGDFFGVGHGRTANFVSAPLQMSPQDGKGFNCCSHAVRARRAGRGHQRADRRAGLLLLLHRLRDARRARRRHRPLPRPVAAAEPRRWHAEQGAETQRASSCSSGTNLDGDGNYMILEADGPRPLRRLRAQHPQPPRRPSSGTGTARATT